MNHNQSSTSILESAVISESNNETRENWLGFWVGGGSPEGRKKIWSKMSQIPYPGGKVKKLINGSAGGEEADTLK